jgi:hypothetical protein
MEIIHTGAKIKHGKELGVQTGGVYFGMLHYGAAGFVS